MSEQEIQKVVVVFKTHLDIGFTDTAANVLRQYREQFIPAAVALAGAANAGGQKRFVWTVGAYLIKHYLEQTPKEKRAAFEQAVKNGWICWHGIACTTHTELMDEELLHYSLGISKKLDEQFGKTTTAAKMTDVPGHTVAMVPALCEAGIRFLHIGVNTSSRVPEVPALFRWRYGEHEVVVNYAGDYGQRTLLSNGVALEFAHSFDNAGPPTLQELNDLYAVLAERYPKAQIEAGTLEDFAAALPTVWQSLPVVEEEIGDTWIHGVGSDPVKVSQFLRLLALKEKWLQEGGLMRGSAEYEVFMEQMLLVSEHTWGMDAKKHLLDFSHWTKADFNAAWERDVTSADSYGAQNAHLLQGMLPELHRYKGERVASSYSAFEASHAEQRAYIAKAVEALPIALARQAKEDFAFTFPTMPPETAGTETGQLFSMGEWQVHLGAHGEIVHLKNDTLGIDKDVTLGLFEYTAYSGRQVDDCYFEYGRDLKQNYFWAEPDFGKPGLRYEQGLGGGSWKPTPIYILAQENTLTVWLQNSEEACETYGCPRQVALEYHFAPKAITLTLFWRQKDAIRSPEGIWLLMDLNMEDAARWRLQKLGQMVNPMQVVPGGNRRLHCVQNLHYAASDGTVDIIPQDSPLVAVGEKALYVVHNGSPKAENGFWFLLCNNRWGTNFKQWFGEDMRFAFTINFM